jgi:hypothetical protein
VIGFFEIGSHELFAQAGFELSASFKKQSIQYVTGKQNITGVQKNPKTMDEDKGNNHRLQLLVFIVTCFAIAAFLNFTVVLPSANQCINSI